MVAPSEFILLSIGRTSERERARVKKKNSHLSSKSNIEHIIISEDTKHIIYITSDGSQRISRHEGTCSPGVQNTTRIRHGKYRGIGTADNCKA